MLRETRNSCHVIETIHDKRSTKLEASNKLQMPPVQTAVAQRRTRKETAFQDSLYNNPGKDLWQVAGINTNISESQKRIKELISNNNNVDR